METILQLCQILPKLPQIVVLNVSNVSSLFSNEEQRFKWLPFLYFFLQKQKKTIKIKVLVLLDRDLGKSWKHLHLVEFPFIALIRNILFDVVIN